MNLAVKPYLYAPAGENELNLPDDYPYQVSELGDDTDLPDNSGHWILMTLVQWNAGAAARAIVFAAAVAAATPPPVFYYVKAKCSDEDAQNALFDELTNRSFEVQKILG